MAYKTPELTALTPAINAIQDLANKEGRPPVDSQHFDDDIVGAYQDWE